MTSMLFKIHCNGYCYAQLEVPNGSSKEEAWEYITENYRKADIGEIELSSCSLEEADYESAKLIIDKRSQERSVAI